MVIENIANLEISWLSCTSMPKQMHIFTVSNTDKSSTLLNGPLTRYGKLLVAYLPRIPGTFSPPPTSKETATCRAVMLVGIHNPHGGKNVPGIPGACATSNFKCLTRGPLGHKKLQRFFSMRQVTDNVKIVYCDERRHCMHDGFFDYLQPCSRDQNSGFGVNYNWHSVVRYCLMVCRVPQWKYA